nr:MAG TPA: hypothetical protein [Caudoviricetes sp.]
MVKSDDYGVVPTAVATLSPLKPLMVVSPALVTWNVRL